MKKIFITGITGFAGSFLAEHLLSSHKNINIFGTYLTDSSLENITKIDDKINLVKIDLTDFPKVSDIIHSIKPDIIYHLAAIPSPAESFKNPAHTIYTNITAELNVLESLRIHNLIETRILIISSAEIYGLVTKDNLPINEEAKFRPVSPYAVSKIAQDFLGLQYHLSFKLDVVRVRPFNHIGPRQSADFVVSSFAKKIALIEKKKMEPVLKVGNLESKRDFTDVRDVVRAYALLMEKGKNGEVYNLGSGVSYKIKDVLDILLSFSKEKIKVLVDPELLRPNDIPELICDNNKVQSLGWKPEIKIEESLKDTLDYWRRII